VHDGERLCGRAHERQETQPNPQLVAIALRQYPRVLPGRFNCLGDAIGDDLDVDFLAGKHKVHKQIGTRAPWCEGDELLDHPVALAVREPRRDSTECDGELPLLVRRGIRDKGLDRREDDFRFR
jgi:hypothetical protein